MNKHSRIHLPQKRKAMEEAPLNDLEANANVSIDSIKSNVEQFDTKSKAQSGSYCSECDIQFSSLKTFLHHRNNYCQKFKTIVIPVDLVKSAQDNSSHLQQSKSRQNNNKSSAPNKSTSSSSELTLPNEELFDTKKPNLINESKAKQTNSKAAAISVINSTESIAKKVEPFLAPNANFYEMMMMKKQPFGAPHPPAVRMGDTVYLPAYKMPVKSVDSPSFIPQLFQPNPTQLDPNYLSNIDQNKFNKSRLNEMKRKPEDPHETDAKRARANENDNSNESPLDLSKKSSSARLQRARLSFDESEFTCELCSGKFSTNQLLQTHKIAECQPRFYASLLKAQYPALLASVNNSVPRAPNLSSANQLMNPLNSLLIQQLRNYYLAFNYLPKSEAKDQSHPSSPQSSSSSTQFSPNLVIEEARRHEREEEEEEDVLNVDENDDDDESKSRNHQKADDDDEEEDEDEMKINFKHSIDESFLEQPLVRKFLVENYGSSRSATRSKPYFICTACGYRGNTSRGVKQHGKLHLTEGHFFGIIDTSSSVEPVLVYSSRQGVDSNHQQRIICETSKQHAFLSGDSRESNNNEDEDGEEEDGREEEEEVAIKKEAPMTNYCEKCEIRFKYTHSYLTHKRNYCQKSN